MSAQPLRVMSATVDGVQLDIRRSSLLPGARGRGVGWELVGWAGPVPAPLRRLLVADGRAQVVVETRLGVIAGEASVSLMAVADGSGRRTMVRIWSGDPLVLAWPGARGASAKARGGPAGGRTPPAPRGR